MTVLSLPFRAGLDEGVDAKDAPAGTLAVAKNVYQDRAGRLVKRNAMTALSVLGPDGVTALYGDQIYSSTRGGIVVARPSAGTTVSHMETPNRWVDGPLFPSGSLTWKPLLGHPGGAFGVNCAYHAGKDLLVTVCTTQRAGTAQVVGRGSLTIVVTEYSTGTVVFGPYELASSFSSSAPQVVILNDTALIMYATAYTTKAGLTLSLSDFTVTTKSGIDSTALDAGGVFDGPFAMTTNGTHVAIVQYLAAGAPDLRVNKVDDTFTDVTTADVNLTARGTPFLAIAADWRAGSDILVVTSDTATPTTDLARLDATTLAVSATSQITANACRAVSVKDLDGTSCAVAVSYTSGSYRLTYTQKRTLSTCAYVANTESVTYQSVLASHLWADSGGRVFAVLGHLMDNGTTDRLAVVEVDITADASRSAYMPAQIVGCLAYEHNLAEPEWGWNAANYNWLAPAQVSKPSSDVALFPAGAYTPVASNGQVQAPTYHLAAYTSGVAPPSCEYQGRLFVGGASPCPPVTRVKTVTGFYVRPEIVSLAGGGGGTGTMAAGTYGYVAVFVWVAPDGTIHRSEPSTQENVTLGAGTNSVTVTLKTAPLAGRYNRFGSAFDAFLPTFVELYRTTLSGGTTVRKITVPPVGDYEEVTPTGQTFTVVDADGDSDIAGLGIALSSQPLVYTASGELPPVTPPSFVHVVEHRGRIAGVAGDRHTIWFSKDTGEDVSLAPEFSPALTLSFADEITALASMDGRLIVFHEDAISTVSGDGPDSNGNANNWAVSGVHSDSGCTDADSVVTFPGGILFRGRRTFELLSRDLAVKEIGRAVVDTLSQYPTVVAATLVRSASQVRWLCNNAGDTAGTILVYDYLHNAWYTWTVHDGSTAGVAFRGAVVKEGVYHVLTKTPKVLYEDSTTSYENSNWVTLDVELAWFGGKNRWSRVARGQLLGTSQTPHRLTMTHSVNYAASAEQTKTWSEGSAVSNVGVLEKAQLTFKTQRAHAHKVRIYDAVPSDTVAYPIGTGKGPILEGLALTVTELPNLPYPSSGQKG